MNKATQRLSGNSLIYWIELNIWNKADIATFLFSLFSLILRIFFFYASSIEIKILKYFLNW